ncbi:excisionase family DNA binding protein [Mycobacteroides chelonae]|nr:excisionase family DNA binding protein [Mycobacteroides chelonae]
MKPPTSQLEPAIEAALRYLGALAVAAADGTPVPADPNLVSAAAAPSSALLTVTEACTYLRVSRWKVYELIRTNALPTVTIGRRRLIPVSAVHRYVTRQLTTNTSRLAGVAR